MNWKLVLRYTITLALVGAGAFTLVDWTSYETQAKSANWVLGLMLLLGTLVAPLICAWFIAKKVQTKRFLHGFLVGMAAIILAGVASIFSCSLLPNMPTGAGQGEGMLIGVMWISSPWTGLLMGFYCWVCGKIQDRRNVAINLAPSLSDSDSGS